MANGDDNGFARTVFSLPQWVKAIAVIGVPGAIALYLVWMGGQILPRVQQEIILNREESNKTQDMLREHLTQQSENYRLLMRICANTAKTPLERGQCFDAR